jgi:heme exporter protein C
MSGEKMLGLKRSVLSTISLFGLTFVSMTAALFLVFLYVPTEQEMGVVQRIFYFHVPLAWVAFLAFFVVFLCSLLYLRRRDMKWDRLARSSAEIGFLFTTLVLITGPIWAKSVWGTWWTWDPRLTATLILWFIYLAYLLVSAYAAEESQGARYAAVVGIIGFIDVPIVAVAIVLWRTQHPGPLVFEGGLAASMLFTLMVCLVAFTLLYFCLLIQRTSLRRDTDEIKMLKQYMDEGD